MTKGELKKIWKDWPDDTELFICERAMDNAHPVDSVFRGWYIDDEMDAPEIIHEDEDPADYDIDPNEKKVIAFE